MSFEYINNFFTLQLDILKYDVKSEVLGVDFDCDKYKDCFNFSLSMTLFRHVTRIHIYKV